MLKRLKIIKLMIQKVKEREKFKKIDNEANKYNNKNRIYKNF